MCGFSSLFHLNLLPSWNFHQILGTMLLHDITHELLVLECCVSSYFVIYHPLNSGLTLNLFQRSSWRHCMVLGQPYQVCSICLSTVYWMPSICLGRQLGMLRLFSTEHAFKQKTKHCWRSSCGDPIPRAMDHRIFKHSFRHVIAQTVMSQSIIGVKTVPVAAVSVGIVGWLLHMHLNEQVKMKNIQFSQSRSEMSSLILFSSNQTQPLCAKFLWTCTHPPAITQATTSALGWQHESTDTNQVVCQMFGQN